MKPREATPADVPLIARLHAVGVHEGFLVTLGPAFLQRLYARVLRSPRAFALVVDDAEGPCGFIAVADDIGRFYREFIVRDGVVAGVVAIPQIVRAPRYVWETLRYGIRRDGDGSAGAEILAIAVDERAQHQGLGGALTAAAVDEIQRRGIVSARVVTASGNVAAIKTYEVAGFRQAGTDTVHRGVTQQVLVWP